MCATVVKIRMLILLSQYLSIDIYIIIRKMGFFSVEAHFLTLPVTGS